MQVRERIARALYEAGAGCGNCEHDGWDSCAECRWILLSYAVAVLDALKDAGLHLLGHRWAQPEGGEVDRG